MNWSDLKFWTSTTLFECLEQIAGEEMVGVKIIPSPLQRYKAFDCTPFDKVKCVILGQDPYPTRGHAHGLAFSVPSNVKRLPPSLKNIFKEYHDDLGFPVPTNGNLLSWARNGVLLFNTVLSVQEGKPNSHKGIGWEKLTIEVIRTLSEKKERIVFILWGKQAQEYRGLIDESKHLVIASSHPSPYSADKGFFGSKPFSRTNEYLDEPIDWRL